MPKKTILADIRALETKLDIPGQWTDNGLMKVLKDFVPLFTAGIFLISFLALLLTGFGYMLKPIEKRIDRLEAGQAKLSEDIAELKQLFYDFKNHSHDQPKQVRKNK